MADEDCRIKVFHYENGGAGRARNIGIEKSTGQYIAFVDSDDYIDEEMLVELLKSIEETQSDVSASALDENDLYYKDFVVDLRYGVTDELYFLLRTNILYGPSLKLYRADIIKKNSITFPIDLNYGEDMVFNIRHMQCINTISYVNHAFYHYIRDNKQSLSQKIRWNMFENDMVFESQLKALFEAKKILKDKVRKYDAYRILGVAYDSLFLLIRSDCPFDHRQRIDYIKKVIHDDLVQWSLAEVDASGYAQWMIKPMKKKNANRIELLTSIKRKFK